MSLLFALSWPLEGCDPCSGLVSGPCDAPIRLVVRDANTGVVIREAAVSGAPGSCIDGRCEVQGRGSGAGRYELSVSAPGYVAQSITVDVPEVEEEGCFGCGYETVEMDVQLQP